MRWSEEEAAEYFAKQKASAKNRKPAPVPAKPTIKSDDKKVTIKSDDKKATINDDNNGHAKEISLASFEKLCAYDPDSKKVKITLPISPVTKKNHGKVVFYGTPCSTCGKRKNIKFLPSDAYKKYQKESLPYLKAVSSVISKIDYPINLECRFYCSKRYKGDLAGYIQAIQDILVENEILLDDNRNIVGSLDGSRVLYDKENPRTEITITPLECYELWGK